MAIKFLSGLNLSNVTAGSILKLDSNGNIVAAVDGTDYNTGSDAWSDVGSDIYRNSDVRIGTYQSGVAPSARLHVFDYQTTDPKLLIEDGNTGDASMQFKISTQSFTMGIDNSDGDKFKISTGSAFTTSDVQIDSSGRVGIGTAPVGGYSITTGGKMQSSLAMVVAGVETGNPQPAANYAHLSGYGIIGNRGTFYITNGGGNVQIGNGATHNSHPTATFKSTGIVLHDYGAGVLVTDATGNVSASTSYQTQSTADSRYLNTSGDTATGILVLHPSSAGAGLRFGQVTDAGSHYRPTEGGSATDRYWLRFDHTNNASYPYLTNRTPSGAVVIKTGTAAGGSENEHFRIKGGDGTVDAYFTNANVGIGTTSPSNKLHVYGGRIVIDNAANAQSAIQINSAGSEKTVIYRPSNTEDLRIYTPTAGDAFTLTQAGNVGIGTSSPVAQLQIDTPASNSAGQGLRLNRPSAGTNYHSVEFATNGTVDWSVGQNSNDAFEVYENGAAATTRLTIKEGGNVGIGTTSPAYNLDVSGSARITGNIWGTNRTSLLHNFVTDASYEGNAFYNPETFNAFAGADKWSTITITNAYQSNRTTSISSISAAVFQVGGNTWQPYFDASETDMVIEIDHTSEPLRYGGNIGIQWTNSGWSARNVKIEVYNGTSWTTIKDITGNTATTVVASHSAGSAGVQKTKFTLGDPNNSSGGYMRISKIFGTDYKGDSSYDVARSGTYYLEKFVDNQHYSNIYPAVDSTYTLGTSTYHYSGVYTDTLYSPTIRVSGTNDHLTLRSDVQVDQGATDPIIEFAYGTTQMGKFDQDGYLYAAGFKTTTASTGFLKADGSVDTSTYASSTHNHNSDYVSQLGGYYDADFNWDGTHDFQDTIKVSGAAATTTNTTALFYGTNGVIEKRTLGSNAFTSYTDHSTQGYLTSYTETDTLDSVTGRGATTTNNISVGNLTAVGGTFTDPVTIYDSTTTENPRLSVGRNSGESIQFSVTDVVNTITAKQDSDSDGDHTFVLDRVFAGAGDSAFSIHNDGTPDLTINGSGVVSFNQYNTAGILQVNTSGTISVDTSSYLTSYTETDTLSSVVARGASTTTAITTGGITADYGYFGSTSTAPQVRIYTENNTASIADTFTDTSTDKSYIYFNAGTNSNDPAYIMHETSESTSPDERNEGVLHLVPSDDNSTGDYVSIHGTNDPDCIKLHTSGLIETASNYQLQLKSGNASVKVDDTLHVTGRLYVDTLDANTTSTSALVEGGSGEIEARTLGSAAFSTATDFVAVGGDTVTGQITFPTAIANRPVFGEGIIARSDQSDTSGTHDIWGISERYYPSNSTAADAWGIQWSGTPNEINFIGAGQKKLSIDLDTAGTVKIDGNAVATESYVTTQISNLVDSAPAALDTLNELAAALGDDASFSTTMSTALGNRLRVDVNNQSLTSTEKANARTNLGLGTAATSAATDFVDLSSSQTITGAKTFSSNALTLKGHMYFSEHSAGRHYIHFKAAGSTNQVDWRIQTNSTNTIVHSWTNTNALFRTNLQTTGTVTATKYLLTVNAPTNVTTSVVNETINVTFTASTTSDIDYYLVFSSVAGGDYGLISVIPPQDFGATMSIIDNSFDSSGTQAYRVYAVKNGVYSSAGTSSRTYTVTTPLEPTNMSVVNLNSAYYIQWDKPSTNARFVTAYNVYKHEAAAQASLSRNSATLIYSGTNTSYMYQISGADNNNYHQFWVETTVG